MISPAVEQIARAVLYEGYILYPYRPTSVKNQQRWTFGGIYPSAFANQEHGTDASEMQTQILLAGTTDSLLTLTVRFLHLTDRTVEQRDADSFRRVASLQVNNRLYHPWQEALERSVELEKIPLRQLPASPYRHPFSFPHERDIEPLEPTARLVRERQQLNGTIQLTAAEKTPGIYQLTARLTNETALAPTPSPGTSGEVSGTGNCPRTGRGEGDLEREESSVRRNHPYPNPLEGSRQFPSLLPAYRESKPQNPHATRDAALLRSFISTHLALTISNGHFFSSTDPPAPIAPLSAQCQNHGCWPVLVGDPGSTDTLLASPIILPDYPQVAPESPGDLFDGCEIDEILTLRILTMTDEEKRQAAAADPRAEQLLSRTEALARDQLMNLHGAIREIRNPKSETISNEAHPHRGWFQEGPSKGAWCGF